MTSSASPEDLGQRLRAARLRRGLTQAEVAGRAGLAPSYLSRIENGRVQPTFRSVMHIVGIVGADVVEITGTAPKRPEGPCPVTSRGRCLLDLIREDADEDHYSPREVRLLRRFATWMKNVEPNRVRAMEILLEDLAR